MKKACLAIILMFMLCVQVLPVSASGQISPFLDGTVSTGSAYLNSSGKGIFRLTVKQEAAEIKVTSCYLYKKDDGEETFKKVATLDPPDIVAKNRKVYSATVDYSSSCTSGETYYIKATFDIDGYTKTYTSPAVTIK